MATKNACNFIKINFLHGCIFIGMKNLISIIPLYIDCSYKNHTIICKYKCQIIGALLQILIP